MKVRRKISLLNHEMVKTVKNTGNSGSASSLPDYVFSDGFSSPECAKILVNCLKIIEL